MGLNCCESDEDVQVVIIPHENRHVWEVDSSYRCALIGATLNSDEHRRVLQKVGFKTKGMALYHVHGIIMQHLRDKNPVSLKVDNYLRHKYKALVEQFKHLNEEEITKEWKNRLDEGGYEGLFYLICVRRDLPSDFVYEIFGDIHMLSHEAVGAFSLAKKTIREQKMMIDHCEQKLKAQKEHNRSQKKMIESLNKQIQKLQTESKKLDVTTCLEELETEMNALSIVKKEQEQILKTMRQEQKEMKSCLTQLSSDNQNLNHQLNESRSLNEHLQSDIEELIQHFSILEESQSSPEQTKEIKQDLDSKRILIVGGMTKIKHLYQHVIEANGGHFDYHDGYLKNGNHNLDAKVSRSDIIICPVNCNSHNACDKVKKLCQKHKKPLKILSNSSVSSISTALFNQGAEINSHYL